MRHHTVVDWTFIVLPLVLMIFLVFLAMKLVLAPVATVAEKRMVTLNAMGLSAGNVGKLFLGVVILALPVAVLGIVSMHLMPHHAMPHHAMTRMGKFQGSVVHVHLIGHVVMAALAVGLLLPLQTGFLASAYRQIVALRVE